LRDHGRAALASVRGGAAGPGSGGRPAGSAHSGSGGNLSSICRPPSGRASACRSAPCAAAMALTIDRPRPCPSRCPELAPRPAPSRWNGANSLDTSPGGTTGPEFATVSVASPCTAPTRRLIQPPGRLCLIALSTRLATRRSASRASPSSAAGPAGPIAPLATVQVTCRFCFDQAFLLSPCHKHAFADGP